ncbi:MAG: carboxypeptidase regulatory-like domain-containing protein [Planctomycetes bacterium]|nr:carboxypeptidase regulatory-like domain-containing protein [Planctomycetota bacterium]
MSRLLILFTVLLLGCSSSDAPELASVTGTVMLDGKPLPNIGVVFLPKGPGPIASGNTDSNGEFTLTTINPNDGASVGEHTVVFGAAEEGKTEFARVNVPARYTSANTSDITATVKSKQANNFEFILKK